MDSNYLDSYLLREIYICTQGDYDRAMEDYNKILEIDNKNIYAYIGISRIYHENWHYDTAIIYYSKIIEIDPNDPVAYINRGISYEELGHHDLALKDYKRL